MSTGMMHSTSPVSGERIWADEKGNMVMFARVLDLERNLGCNQVSD